MFFRPTKYERAAPSSGLPHGGMRGAQAASATASGAAGGCGVVGGCGAGWHIHDEGFFSCWPCRSHGAVGLTLLLSSVLWGCAARQRGEGCHGRRGAFSRLLIVAIPVLF